MYYIIKTESATFTDTYAVLRYLPEALATGSYVSNGITYSVIDKAKTQKAARVIIDANMVYWTHAEVVYDRELKQYVDTEAKDYDIPEFRPILWLAIDQYKFDEMEAERQAEEEAERQAEAEEEALQEELERLAIEDADFNEAAHARWHDNEMREIMHLSDEELLEEIKWYQMTIDRIDNHPVRGAQEIEAAARAINVGWLNAHINVQNIRKLMG